MIRLVFSNQRGGVGKTTSALNYAFYLARLHKKVLLIDTDSQGSVGQNLGLKPARFLHNFIVHKELLDECVTLAAPNVDVLCSNRSTHEAEAALLGQMAREMALKYALEPVIGGYDAVLLDASPSISVLQSCSMMFAGAIVIPVAMDLLSITGAQTSIQTVQMLNRIYNSKIQVVGFLPTGVNVRLQATAVVQTALKELSELHCGIAILPAIRVDQAIAKAERARQSIFDYDPKSKAAEDYTVAFDAVTSYLSSDAGETAKAS
jgi:chromosome partitioning protein